jgi:hypothetical protein
MADSSDALARGTEVPVEGFIDVSREFHPSAEPFQVGEGLAIAIGVR